MTKAYAPGSAIRIHYGIQIIEEMLSGILENFSMN
jgi:hypothetical protein